MTKDKDGRAEKMVRTYNTELLTFSHNKLVYIRNLCILLFAKQCQRRQAQQQSIGNYFLKTICTWAGDHSLKLALSKLAEGNPKSEHRLFMYDPLMSVVPMAFSDKGC